MVLTFRLFLSVFLTLYERKYFYVETLKKSTSQSLFNAELIIQLWEYSSATLILNQNRYG